MASLTTKDKILKSALKLFAKQGIDKTSTQQITEDVGIASGTLFVHFKTKQELIDTLYIQIKKGMFAHVSQSLKEHQSVEESLKSASKGMIEYYLKNYSEFKFIELVETDPQVSKTAVEAGQKEYADFVKIVAEWQKQGVLKDIDLKLLGDFMWYFIIVLVKYYKENKIKEVDKKHLDLLWDAVKR